LTRYFLDTTIHVERWGGDRSVREDIEGRLSSGGPHATSTHCLREWKSIVLGSAADVLNSLRGGASWQDIFAVLSSGFGREQAQRLRVLSIITAGEDSVDPKLLETRADVLVRYGAEELFHRNVATVRDGSRCALAKNEVVQRLDGEYIFTNVELGNPRCRNADNVCDQVSDLESKVARLGAAAAALSKSGREPLRKAGNAGMRAVKDRSKRKGQNCWTKLGDLSIALECADDEILLTTDHSFEEMAPALGIAVERLDYTKSPRAA
jgi:hypothetical protein